MDFIKDGFSRIEKSITKLDEKTDDLVRNAATKSEVSNLQLRIDGVEDKLAAHEAKDGHPLALQRIAALEGAGTRGHQRKLETWQVVVGAIGTLATMAFVVNSMIGTWVGIIELLISLHIIRP